VDCAALEQPQAGRSVSGTYYEISAARREEALSKGFRGEHFFPHRFYCLPKCGPDGFKLAQRMCGTTDPSACREIVLYAAPALIDEFPRELFFDDEIVWHQQHFGRPGQIATVDLAVHGQDLYAIVHISDIVQRIARRPPQRTRIQNRFKGWHHMLLNAVANFAVEHRLARVFVPDSALAMLHTDRKRVVQSALFERIYDRDVCSRFPGARHVGSWWVIETKDLSGGMLPAEKCTERIVEEKTICITHDIERGLGYEDVDPAIGCSLDDGARRGLDEMLAIEADARIRATYNIVGVLFGELRPRIERNGHCIAFHSYDHRVDGAGSGVQLRKCRSVDYRIKGYRAPRSVIDAELTEANLCAHNFEWLASSVRSLGIRRPVMQKGIVRVPILFDDHTLFQRRIGYAEWERNALQSIEASEFVAFGLHDCYAPLWLPRYRDFLRRVGELGNLRTIDAVAFDVIMSSAIAGPVSATAC
jgi:hypothetical protein